MPQRLIRVADLRRLEPGCPCCPPGLRPLLRHNERGAGLVNGELRLNADVDHIMIAPEELVARRERVRATAFDVTSLTARVDPDRRPQSPERARS